MQAAVTSTAEAWAIAISGTAIVMSVASIILWYLDKQEGRR